MTLADAEMYFAHGAKYPSVRAMVAGYLKIKPPRRQDLSELLGMFGVPGDDGRVVMR